MTFPHSKHTPFWFAHDVQNAAGEAQSPAHAPRRRTLELASLTLAAQRLAHGLLSFASGLFLTGAAHAHEGHGLPGVSHWHGTDTWGFVMAAAIAAGVAIWMKGRK